MVIVLLMISACDRELVVVLVVIVVHDCDPERGSGSQSWFVVRGTGSGSAEHILAVGRGSWF